MKQKNANSFDSTTDLIAKSQEDSNIHYSTITHKGNVRPDSHIQLIDMAELPLDIQTAINYMLELHPQLKTKQGAFGNCYVASHDLVFTLGRGYVDGVDQYTPTMPHHWAVIDDWCIDLTARQFDNAHGALDKVDFLSGNRNNMIVSTSPCPKIWKVQKAK